MHLGDLRDDDDKEDSRVYDHINGLVVGEVAGGQGPEVRTREHTSQKKNYNAQCIHR